jgi:RHS repeat-associated protein
MYGTARTNDTLNNLTTVTQGSQARTFTYNSLSRLLSAANPESGTISYGYDPNGNLTSKVDARSITTSYVYDVLNRVTDRNYTNEPSGSETPDVDYFYGTTAPKVGKLTKVSSSVSTTEYTSFDILGRVTGHKQTTDGNEYTTGYTYKLSGALDEQTYPSGRVVKNELDASGDLATVTSKENSSAIFKTYANDFTYTAAGAISSLKLGNGRFESTQFNNRLQPTQIALGSSVGNAGLLKIDYTYNTTGNADNNGNVLSQTITVPTVGSNNGFVAVQSYSYDPLNRLKDAVENVTPTGGSSSQSWKQEFSFDRYGNRSFVTGTGHTDTLGSCTTMCNPTFDATNNRITSSGFSFDSSGNTTRDAADRKFTYDAENKQTKAETLSAGTNTVTGTIGEYSYDGDGKRVKKYVPATGETTIFVYDAAGKLIGEYSTIVENSTNAKVNYLTSDHLGSPRVNTDVTGSVIARHDYYPFGEEIAATGSRSTTGYTIDTVRKQFTGYERDEETDLDFAQARYNSSNLGRFSSPDPFDAVSTDLTLYQFNRFLAQPQNWNKYTYCLNNPFRYVDMDGRHPVAALLLALAARAATGAAIGAVVVGGIELMTQMIMGGDINWDRVRNAAIAGAIGGAITGGASAIPMATFRGLAGKLAVAGVSNGVEGVVQRGLNGEENNIASILTDVLTGAIAYGATKHANELLDRSSKIATQDSVSKISQHYRVSDPPVFGSYIRQNRAMQYRNLRTFREFGSDTLTNTNGEVMEQIFPNVFQWKPKGNAKLETDVRMTRICDENGKNCEDVQ